MSSAGNCGASSPNTLAVFDSYRGKYVGIDMILKAICYFLRLRNAWTPDDAVRAERAKLVGSIVDCRMLCNSMKHFATLKQGVRAWEKTGKARPEMPLSIRLLTVFSYLFRVVEQVFSDLGYLQKHWFSQWSRVFLSTNYKRWKSFSLVCCAIVEVSRIRATAAKLLELPSLEPSPERERKGIPPVSSMMQLASPASRHNTSPFPDGVTPPSASPVDATTPSPDTPPGSGCRSPVTEAREDFPVRGHKTNYPGSPYWAPPGVGGTRHLRRPSAVDLAEREEQRAELRTALRRSCMFLVRNLCDLVVYLVWLSWWRPWATIESVCGMASGLLGAILVWEVTVAEESKKIAAAAKRK